MGDPVPPRYKAILVNKESSYFLALCRYIVLNPVRAKIVERPDLYLYDEMFRYIQNLDLNTQIIRGYLPDDFTVLMRK